MNPSSSGSRTGCLKNRPDFPVDHHRRQLLYLLERHRVLLVVGGTGSGKSTRIPHILFSAGIYNQVKNIDGFQIQQMICITQPRRVTTIQLAQRVAQDLNCPVGTTVGYSVRFDEAIKEGLTMIKYMTEGLLLREMIKDPLMSNYSVIMIDEVHERNSNTDLLLGLLKCILLKRSDLRVIICSATLNIDILCKFFTYDDQIITSPELREPGVLCIEGQSHEVMIFYKDEPVPNYLDATISTIIDIHESSRLASGKILAFLTGQDEVEYVCEHLETYALSTSSRLDLKQLLVLPLHASLRADEISRVFEDIPRKSRLCIVSTNVAENSLTIDDVAFVIDCGFHKLKTYNPRTGIDVLERVPVSKSSAKQRAGRAGRTRKGQVFRLYSENAYNDLPGDTVPEIQRLSLVEIVMILKSLGVDNVRKFPLPSSMPRQNLIAALELLHALRAIDNSGQLTSNGELMASFSLDPRQSKILITPEASSCNQELCRIIAALQVKDIYTKGGRNASALWSNEDLLALSASEGDLLTYLNITNGFIASKRSRKWAEKRHLNYKVLDSIVDIAARLESQLIRHKREIVSSNGRIEPIMRSLVSGFFANAAYLHPNGDYKTVRGDITVHLHPTSVFSELIDRPKYVVYMELMNTTKSYMRHVLSVELEWLLDAAPNFYRFETCL